MVALIKVPAISVALAALIPAVIPPVTEGAVQLYSVPAGIVPLVGINANEAPLHTEAVIALIVAKGLTVMVTVKMAPLQIPETGVTI